MDFLVLEKLMVSTAAGEADNWRPVIRVRAADEAEAAKLGAEAAQVLDRFKAEGREGEGLYKALPWSEAEYPRPSGRPEIGMRIRPE